MNYTVVITRETDPDGYVATIPLLDLVTEGDSVAEALAAAKEAITLELRGRAGDREAVPVEPADFASLHVVAVGPESGPQATVSESPPLSAVATERS